MLQTGEMPAIGNVSSAAQRLRRLGTADLLRLKRIAQFNVRGLPGEDWRDLLHEAFVRFLDGRRVVAEHTAIVPALGGIMKSIASDRRRRGDHRWTVTLPYERLIAILDQDGAVTADDNPRASPERIAAARHALEGLMALFSEDCAAVFVLSAFAEGRTPDEIRCSLSISETAYASIRRRIRRTVVRYLADMEEREEYA